MVSTLRWLIINLLRGPLVGRFWMEFRRLIKERKTRLLVVSLLGGPAWPVDEATTHLALS